MRRTGYLHPLRINIGFVALSDAAAVLAAANRVVARAAADGTLERWSKQTHTSWIEPAEPAIGAPIGMQQLRREDWSAARSGVRRQRTGGRHAEISSKHSL